MKSKKGPLGTPLGNPLKYFNDQKVKAQKGIVAEKYPDSSVKPVGMDQPKGDRAPNPLEQRYPESFLIDTSKYNPNSKEAKALKTLKSLDTLKNKPMKKGGSVKRKKK